MASTSRASRPAVVCAGVLAAVHLLGAALATGDPMERAGGLILCSVLFAAAVGIARGNRFGARLAAVVICVLDLVALTLELTVGPPGEAREPFGPAHAAVGLLAAAVLALILVDARARRGRASVDDKPPYAL